MKFKRSLLLMVFLFVPLVGHTQAFVDGGSPLGRAQQAYVIGDFKSMALNLRQALEQNPTDSIVKENALSLLKKAYENSGDSQIPVDWRLPDEIKDMKVGVKYSVKDDGRYILRVYGSTKHEGSIKQLQIIQYPDRVVLDKSAGVGGWTTQSQIDSLDHEYELQSERSRQTIPSGLYLLNLTLNDGTQTKGWFILGDDINSTSSPRVYAPTADEVFNTGNPTFQWQNFTSPQYQAFERRSLWVGVSRAEPPDYNWDEVYGHYEAPPTSEEITVNANGDAGSLPTLKKGRYVFFVDYHERHLFGDLKITRDSITLRNFRVN